MKHPKLEIGQIFNGPRDMKSPEGISTLQPAIYRHSKNTWFVGSALSMPDWKELDHRFYKIVNGDHRMIDYCSDWIAQFHDVKRAWVWFDILSRGVNLSNAKEHLKQIKLRREAREEEAYVVSENNNLNPDNDRNDRNHSLDGESSKTEKEPSQKKPPGQGNLFD